MRVLVVGSSGVIGKAVVNLFASDETNIIAATSRTGERMQDESRRNIHVYPLDFSDMERARIQIDTITRNELRLDAIVVATGILRTSFSLVADNETEQMQINFLRVIEVLNIVNNSFQNCKLFVLGTCNVYFINSQKIYNKEIIK